MEEKIGGFIVLSGGFPTGAPVVAPVGFCIGGAVAVGKPVGTVWPKVADGSQEGCMKSLLKVDTKWLVYGLGPV